MSTDNDTAQNPTTSATDATTTGETPTKTPPTTATVATANANVPTTIDSTGDLDSLKAQLSAVNAESAERRHKIKELSEQLTSATERATELTGTNEKLSARLEALKSDKETLTNVHAKTETALTAIVAKLSTGLPDSTKSLLEKLDPVAQAEWLAENAPTATRNVSGRAGNNAVSSNNQTDELMAAVARKYNIRNIPDSS